jgi:hypothetical protein
MHLESRSTDNTQKLQQQQQQEQQFLCVWEDTKGRGIRERRDMQDVQVGRWASIV